MVLREERTGIEKKFFELCTKVVTDEGFDLYDMDYLPGSHCLRLYINQKGTDTALIEDCAKVDRALTPYIDESDWMPEILNLEVSSPGLFRQLTSVLHFQMVEGKDVNLHLKKGFGDYAPENIELAKKVKTSKKIIVALKKATEDKIEIEYEGTVLDIPFTEIKKANLETKF